MSEKRVVHFEIADSFISEFQTGNTLERTLVKRGVPPDAKIIEARLDASRGVVILSVYGTYDDNIDATNSFELETVPSRYDV